MSTFIVRPDGYLYQSGGFERSTDSGATWGSVTNAQLAICLGDNSDATRIRSTATSGSSYWRTTVTAPTIPSDEFVCRVGGSVRYSHGQAGKYVGVTPYSTLGAVPGGISTYAVEGTTTLTSREVGYVIKAWTKAEAAKLALYGLTAGGSTSAVRPVIEDAWATVYTLKVATAAPQARTETTSTFPTCPVDVTATIGWESTSYDWQDLRKVTVEVRIESGGTGVGTGTLRSTTSADILFTATGTETLNVSMPDSLANGTYKIYSRATRYRESGFGFTVQSEQVSAWSTAATLTMSVTPPTAPTVTTSVNQTTDAVTVTATPPSSAGYSTPYVTLERSVDAGTTWTALRNGTRLAATFGSGTAVVDYEAPQGIAVQYRANVTATTGGFEYTSSWSTAASATVNLDTWNLKSPEVSSLNAVGLLVLGSPEEIIGEDLAVFRPLNRRTPVVVSGTLTGWDGALTIHCPDAATWSSVEALIESQRILYLESPFGWARYVRILPGAKARMLGTTTAPRREVTFSYVEVEAP